MAIYNDKTTTGKSTANDGITASSPRIGGGTRHPNSNIVTSTAGNNHEKEQKTNKDATGNNP